MVLILRRKKWRTRMVRRREGERDGRKRDGDRRREGGKEGGHRRLNRCDM